MANRWTFLYKYVGLDYLENILDNHRLYLSDGKNFNDPFEITIADKGDKTVKHINGLHILSLTNSNRKKLMWSHYTESHKGACLTVKVPSELVYPICYTTKRVFEDSDIDQILSTGTIKSKKNLVKPYSSLSKSKKIALIKDRKWIYENEYRIVFDSKDEKGLIFEDNKWFMSVKITNVYLGVNFDKNKPTVQESVLKACSRNNIQVARMALSSTDYSLRIKR